MKKEGRISIAVTGRTNSGKTTVMKTIIDALTAKGIEVEPNWDIDGPPRYSPPELEQKRVQAVAAKTKVVLSEFTSERTKSLDLPDYVKIRVTQTAGIGTELCVHLMGVSMRHNFGNHEGSRDKALAVGERLAAELGIEVIDDTVRPLEWHQPT